MAGLRRKIKKLSKAAFRKLRGTQILICKECGEVEVEVGNDIVSVICSSCVARMSAPPPQMYTKKVVDPTDRKPRGWHFKIYFEQNGVVYSKGEVVTDEATITKLRKEHIGKTPTKKVPKKSSKRGRKNARSTK